MILTIQIKNYFPVGGHIQLTFPPTLAWSRDISTNHLFPIDGILSCEGMSLNVNTVINCFGQRSTRIVAFANIVNSEITAGQVIKFKIKNMFSPPTTQSTNPSDSLFIKTFDVSSNQIEYKQSFVSELQAKTVSNLQIIPLTGQSNFIVNRNTGLNFTFILEDTVNFQDYFQIIFPPSTSITYSTPSSTFRFSSANFNKTNTTLTFFQSSTNNPERMAGSSVSIGFVTYRAPKSCRIQSIHLKVMRYGFEKMIGSSTVRTEPNQYSITSISLNETKVNAKTILTATFELRDPLSNSGLILFQIPQRLIVNTTELQVECISTLSSGARIKQFPSFAYFNFAATIESPSRNTSLTCSSLGGCLIISSLVSDFSLELANQNITLSIKGLRNIHYVVDIDSLMIRTFYDSEFDSKVAQISQSNTMFLRTTSGLLAINAINFANPTINFQKSRLSMSLKNENSIPLTGNLLINIPNDFFVELSLTNDSKMLISLLINGIEVASNQMFPVSVISNKFVVRVEFSTISFGNASTVSDGSIILLNFQAIIAATSKQPLSSSDWYVQSTTSQMNLIDEFKPLNNSNFVYRTFYENSLVSIRLIRSSLVSSQINELTTISSKNDCIKNGMICGSYIFGLSQEQPFQIYGAASNNQNIIAIEIPSGIDVATIKNAYIGIEFQMVFADSQMIKIYKPVMNASIRWMKCQLVIASLNNTNILSLVLPLPVDMGSLSFVSQSTYNRLQLPFSMSRGELKSSFYILIQNIRNPYSLSPFSINFQTEKKIQNFNTYLYSSGVSEIYKNTELIEFSVASFDFSNKYFKQQSNLTIKVQISNWNEVSSTLQIRNSSKNNVKYLILAMGNSFSFNNITSLTSCYIDILSVRENVVCTIEEISPDFSWTKKINTTGNPEIVNVLSTSKYLVVLTLSDSLSSILQTASQTDDLTVMFGPVINPSFFGQSLLSSFKSVSIFTLTQSEYLIHKGLLQIVFSTNCLSPCKECIFTTNLSTEISTTCKSCNSGFLLYNKTCLGACPDKTYQSTTTNSNNTSVIGICVDCLLQCGFCINGNSCTQCNSSTYFKYQLINTSTNTTDCVSSCPINGFYENVMITNATSNLIEYQCSMCKTNCSICSSGSDCFKCSGFLILRQNLCIEQCPSGTVQSRKDIVYKNTTVNDVSVCLECSAYLQDSGCAYCNSSLCLACRANYSLDYLVTQKCVSQCSEGYYSVGNKVLKSQNWTYSVCEMCSMECRTCKDTAVNCLTCKWFDNTTASQYYQLGNNCYLASNCPSGSYPNSTTKTCNNCSLAIIGCITCSSQFFCTTCNSTAGYYNFTSTQINSSSGLQNMTISTCLTSQKIPKGFLLINGSIQKCDQFCTECSIGVSNCTDCISGYYLFNLDTGMGMCVNQCSVRYYPANAKLCTVCPYPCENCQLNPNNFTDVQCLSCKLNSSLYFYQNKCIQANECPNTTYPYTNVTTNEKSCQSCLNNCQHCEDDGVSCIDCQSNFYLSQQTCISKQNCPNGTISLIINQTSNQGKCVPCQSPCETCSPNPTTCTSCISQYLFNSFSNQCLTSCPSPLISNNQTRECVQCSLPCMTCQNSPTNCMSCIESYYRSQSTCVVEEGCMLGFYANRISKNCEPCPSPCANCSLMTGSNSVVCYRCTESYVLYEGVCWKGCPAIKKYNVSGVCMNCTEAIVGCLVCTYTPLSTTNGTNQALSDQVSSELSPSKISSSDFSQSLGCGSCSFPYIFLNNSCMLFCPSGYLYKQETNECITVEHKADQILSKSLSNPTIMPLPFTIVSCIILVACILSKLQNENTYLIGTLYSILAIPETLSVAYLILRIITTSDVRSVWADSSDTFTMLFFIVLAWIYLTNLLSLPIQTCVLASDKKFKKYRGNHCLAFVVVSIISSLTSYKFKLIISTRLFSFSCFKCQLESIQKFSIFNVFSFIGIGHEGLLLYVIGLTLARFKSNLGDQIFLAMLDVGIIAVLNLLLALAVSKKDQDFFYQKYEGIVINKKIDAGQDQQTIDYHKQADTSKASLNEDGTPYKSTGIQSHENLMHQISQDDEFSLSISKDDSSDRKSNLGGNIFDIKEEKSRENNKNSSEDEEEMKSSDHLRKLKDGPMRDMMSNGDLKIINKSLNLSRSRQTLDHLQNNKTLNKSQIFFHTKELTKRDTINDASQKMGRNKTSGLNSLNNKYRMDKVNESEEKGQRSEEKLITTGFEGKEQIDFIDEKLEKKMQEHYIIKQEYRNSQLDQLCQTQEKELPNDYTGGIDRGWQIDENSNQNIHFQTASHFNNFLFEQKDKKSRNLSEQKVEQNKNPSRRSNDSEIHLNENGQNSLSNQMINQDGNLVQVDSLQNNPKQILNPSVIKVASNVAPQYQIERDGFYEFSESPFNEKNLSKGQNTSILMQKSQFASNENHERKLSSSKVFSISKQSSTHEIDQNQSKIHQINSKLSHQQGIRGNEQHQKAKDPQIKQQPHLQIPSSIKSIHKSNNLFNQPLQEGQAMQISLLEQKQKELALLRKSRQNLENQNKKLKNRSRSRSKSLRKGSYSVSKDEFVDLSKNNEGNNKIDEIVKLATKNQNQNEFENEKHKVDSNDSQQKKELKLQLQQKSSSPVSEKNKEKTQNDTDLIPQNSLLQKNEIDEIKLQTQNQQKQENEIIVFEESQQKTNDLRDKVSGIKGQNANTQKQRIEHILKTRLQRKESRKKLSTEELSQIKQSKQSNNLDLNWNLLNQETQDCGIRRNPIKNEQIDLRMSNKNDTNILNIGSNLKRIDVGEFGNENESNQHDDQETNRIGMDLSSSKSKRRIIQDKKIQTQSSKNNWDTVYNTGQKEAVNPMTHLLPNPPKNRDISSVDRISPSKMRPPTSKAVQTKQKREFPPQDTSFMSGKPVKSSYPLYNRNKQMGSQKDDSQIELSFYPIEQGANGGENSFIDFKRRSVSKEFSSYSSRLKDEGTYVNDLPHQPIIDYQFKGPNQRKTQPIKPMTLLDSKLDERKMQENDELSILINKNVNKKISTSRVQRHSAERGSIPREPGLRTQRRSSLRNQSANSINRSIENNQKLFEKHENSIEKHEESISQKNRSIHNLNEQDALDDYYNRGRRQNNRQSGKNQNRSRSRSKSRERPLSKESENKLKALQKIYLQKIQWKK